MENIKGDIGIIISNIIGYIIGNIVSSRTNIFLSNFEI